MTNASQENRSPVGSSVVKPHRNIAGSQSFWRLPLAALLLTPFAVPAFGQAAGNDAQPGNDADSSTSPAPGAADIPTPEAYSVHLQFTNVTQYHPPFTSPYRGANSLDPGHRGDETNDATLYLGVRLWDGGEFYVNPEVDQGFGLNNTLGVAGFPSGEAYKVGQAMPYGRLPRAFFRFTFGTGGVPQPVEPEQNQLGGELDSNNVTITLGKFSVTDIFDNNSYAHDPRGDFLNWSIIDAATFDYAADSWGYTYGGAVEWTEDWWTLRAGGFDLSRTPNSKYLNRFFEQYSLITEAEERHQLFDQPGKLKLLLYVNRGNMADYTAAIRAAAGTGNPPDVSMVRGYASRPGVSLNFEQQVASDLGVFARASLNDGHKEAYDFTDVNQSLSGGLSCKGDRWSRPNDTIGLAGVINGISRDARAYFAAGGLGILIGDGQLKNYGPEQILETYYSLSVSENLVLSADYQFIENPAYNRDRGPVSAFGFRVHAEI